MNRDQPGCSTSSPAMGVDDAPSLNLRFLSAQEWTRIAGVLKLSPRESQIALAVLGDLGEAKIAALLSISVHTVHSHFERLYRKLRCSNRTALVIRIFETYVRLADMNANAGDSQAISTLGTNGSLSGHPAAP